MSRYTPGPWTPDGLTIYAPNGYRVCRITEPHKNERGKDRVEGNEYRDANGRLIAAAPDLLAVAELLDALCSCGSNPGGVGLTVGKLHVAWDLARAAIAKATGAA